MTNANQLIATKFNIRPEMADQVIEAAQQDALDTIDNVTYMALYNHYCESGEMPYEEASSGDPYAWIANKLTEEFNLE